MAPPLEWHHPYPNPNPDPNPNPNPNPNQVRDFGEVRVVAGRRDLVRPNPDPSRRCGQGWG